MLFPSVAIFWTSVPAVTYTSSYCSAELELLLCNQLFQFNGQLYQQTDGVAMGSPLGPLMANVFMGLDAPVVQEVRR